MEKRSTYDPLFSSCDLEREATMARALAERLLFDADLAEDAIQQTWLAVLEHPPRDANNAGGWFTAIAKNCALKILRTRGRASRREQRATLAETITPSPLETLDRIDLITTLREELEKLAEPYRSTLRKRFYDGMPPQEIAETEGLSIDAIRSRLQRGLGMLRARLATRTGEDRRRHLACGLFVLAKRPDAHAFAEALTMRARFKLRSLSWPTIQPRIAMLGAIVLTSVLALPAISFLTHFEPTSLGDAPNTTGSANARGAEATHSDDSERRAVLDVSSATQVTAAETGSRTLEIFVERERDGSPAAGIRLEAICFADPNPQLMPRPLVTDASGRAVLLDAPAGPARVRIDRGGEIDISIAETGMTSTRIELALGIDVNGEVKDVFGRPVAGAEIWLSNDDAATRGSFVATSDSSGRFALGDVAPGRAIAAFHREGSPAIPVVVAGIRGSTRAIELRLGARSASLSGTVIDSRGRPIAGRVRIEPEGAESSRRAPPPLEVDCSADGRFFATGLRRGRARVIARSPLHPPVRVDVDLTSETTLDRTIELGESTAIQGVVRDTIGSEVPYAFVRIGSGTAFHDCLVRADNEGKYTLLGAPVGECALRADSDRGNAVEAIVVDPRGLNSVDLSIEPGVSCDGRLVAIDGDRSLDLSTFSVRLEPVAEDAWLCSRRVDAARSGHFSFPSVAAGRYRLTVHVRGLESKATPVTGRVITLPIATDLLLEVPSPRTQSTLTGTLRGQTGRSAFVEIVDAQGVIPTRTVACDGAGRFRCETMRPGQYYLRGNDADGRRGRFETANLEPGETTIVTLELPRLAVLEITCAVASAAEQTSLRILDEAGSCVVDRNALEPLTRIELPPGEYRVVGATRHEPAVSDRAPVGDSIDRTPGLSARDENEWRVALKEGETTLLRLENRPPSR